jgi:hypothetical protein
MYPHLKCRTRWTWNTARKIRLKGPFPLSFFACVSPSAMAPPPNCSLCRPTAPFAFLARSRAVSTRVFVFCSRFPARDCARDCAKMMVWCNFASIWHNNASICRTTPFRARKRDQKTQVETALYGCHAKLFHKIKKKKKKKTS